jgi:hypothetical protein
LATEAIRAGAAYGKTEGPLRVTPSGEKHAGIVI